jgi:hypothetical protein
LQDWLEFHLRFTPKLSLLDSFKYKIKVFLEFKGEYFTLIFDQHSTVDDAILIILETSLEQVVQQRQSSQVDPTSRRKEEVFYEMLLYSTEDKESFCMEPERLLVSYKLSNLVIIKYMILK